MTTLGSEKAASWMIFEWDEAKRLSNLEKHGLEFLDVSALFGGFHVRGEAATIAGEERWWATGRIDDVLATVIFTRRGDAIRVISLRRARHEERRRYQALHLGRA